MDYFDELPRNLGVLLGKSARVGAQVKEEHAY
jgi:hypothetical protein